MRTLCYGGKTTNGLSYRAALSIAVVVGLLPLRSLAATPPASFPPPDSGTASAAGAAGQPTPSADTVSNRELAGLSSMPPSASIADSLGVANNSAPVSLRAAGQLVVRVKPVANLIPPGFFSVNNGLPPELMSRQELIIHLTRELEMARYLRRTRQPKQAEPRLVEVLDDSSSEYLQQSALLELAATVEDENDLPRAQQIYAQFLSKWPDDPRVPEILLRQGLLFRRMGLYNLAITKFYAVMTSALVLKDDQFDYYVRLVSRAQTQIAETNYELGKYAEAAKFFSRLLKQTQPGINKSEILYRLTRCHAALGDYTNAVADAEDFLKHFSGSPEQPEIRYHLALALKKLGRNNDSLQQVLLLLREEHARTQDQPEVWAYWQQRAGNLIANQLYHEGDYARALEIYQNLAQLDPSPQWQLPVEYQIGLTYEHLWQPQKAAETYNRILSQESQLGTNAPPSLKTLFDMARWRVHFIKWEGQAQAANLRLHDTFATNTAVASRSSTSRPAVP